MAKPKPPRRRLSQPAPVDTPDVHARMFHDPYVEAVRSALHLSSVTTMSKAEYIAALETIQDDVAAHLDAARVELAEEQG